MIVEEESKITVKPLEDRVLVKIRKAPDKVLFTKYAGNEIKEIGEDYLIMREGDVLARLEPGV